MEELLPGVFQWSWFSHDKGYGFNGTVLLTQGDHVIVDPPPLDQEDLEWLEEKTPFSGIILTNRDHVREAESLRSRLGAPIYAPDQDAPLIDISVDYRYKDQDRLPGDLKAIHMADQKSPGETALWSASHDGTLILGDALIGVPAGELKLMPPEKYLDAKKAKEGLRVLLECRFDKILVGDGTPILKDGMKALQDFFSK